MWFGVPFVRVLAHCNDEMESQMLLGTPPSPPDERNAFCENDLLYAVSVTP